MKLALIIHGAIDVPTTVLDLHGFDRLYYLMQSPTHPAHFPEQKNEFGDGTIVSHKDGHYVVSHPTKNLQQLTEFTVSHLMGDVDAVMVVDWSVTLNNTAAEEIRSALQDKKIGVVYGDFIRGGIVQNLPYIHTFLRAGMDHLFKGVYPVYRKDLLDNVLFSDNSFKNLMDLFRKTVVYHIPKVLYTLDEQIHSKD